MPRGVTAGIMTRPRGKRHDMCANCRLLWVLGTEDWVWYGFIGSLGGGFGWVLVKLNTDRGAEAEVAVTLHESGPRPSARRSRPVARSRRDHV